MTTVLILTHSNDLHADAVAWALRRRGVAVTQWHLDRLPLHDAAALAIDGNGALRFSLQDGTRLDAPFDVVWRRRGRVRPRVDADLPESDQIVAEREARQFLESALAVLAPKARWINPSAAATRASAKPVQLQAARQAGMRIPATLLSNDPAAIRTFFNDCGGKVIVKPFYPASWRSGDTGHKFYATALTSDLLTDDFPLRAAPAIYQEQIARADEYRVTVMGQSCLTMRIAPTGDTAAIDCKADLEERLCEAGSLPSELHHQCLTLVRSLGLEFGCIDLVRGPDGAITFLEINEMGAFLWLEDLVPELPMLQSFCDFICDPGSLGPQGAIVEGSLMAAYRASPDYSRFTNAADPTIFSYLYQQQLQEAA